MAEIEVVIASACRTSISSLQSTLLKQSGLSVGDIAAAMSVELKN